ncbi:hypothetical protein HMPREF1253_1916 [Peptoniphilus sp. BV3C26]|nr:hypothetical protein HMPREF1253_1916 [Peptoniphilus sp. BV3C26]
MKLLLKFFKFVLGESLITPKRAAEKIPPKVIKIKRTNKIQKPIFYFYLNFYRIFYKKHIHF